MGRYRIPQYDEVLKLISENVPAKEIARGLGVSLATVKDIRKKNFKLIWVPIERHYNVAQRSFWNFWARR